VGDVMRIRDWITDVIVLVGIVAVTCLVLAL
jgi:hypothetical protein